MTEYILIVALVAIASIGLVGFFGDDLRHLFGDSATALKGNDSVSNTGSTNAPSPTKNLSTFGYNGGGSIMRQVGPPAP